MYVVLRRQVAGTQARVVRRVNKRIEDAKISSRHILNPDCYWCSHRVGLGELP